MDLRRLSPFDWSRLALRALPTRARRAPVAPRWALLAALQRVGIRRRILDALVKEAPLAGEPLSREERERAQFFAAAAPASVPNAYIVVYTISSEPWDVEVGRPLLYVPDVEYEQSVVGLDWLQGVEMFEAILEEGEDEPQA
jgi:hypothetical protein